MTYASKRFLHPQTSTPAPPLPTRGVDLLRSLAELFRATPSPPPLDERLREDAGLPPDDRPVIEVDAVAMARLRGLS